MTTYLTWRRTGCEPPRRWLIGAPAAIAAGLLAGLPAAAAAAPSPRPPAPLTVTVQVSGTPVPSPSAPAVDPTPTAAPTDGPPDGGGLARTGESVVSVIALGVALLTVGIAVRRLGRRRVVDLGHSVVTSDVDGRDDGH